MLVLAAKHQLPQLQRLAYQLFTANLRAAAAAAAAGKLKEFKAYMASEGEQRQDVAQLRQEVEALATSFPMPGL
jgi:glycine hydroxymethyltransferase